MSPSVPASTGSSETFATNPATNATAAASKPRRFNGRSRVGSAESVDALSVVVIVLLRWPPRRRQHWFRRDGNRFEASSGDILAFRDHPPREFRVVLGVPRLDAEPARSALGRDESVGTSVRREEHVVVVEVHERGEIRIDRHLSAASEQFGFAEILEPALRALHAIEPAM